MAENTNKFLVFVGTYTLVQAQFQFVLSLLAIVQSLCLVNFLRTYPLLIFLRILYFHNTSRCGGDINVGNGIEELANQAFVYLSSTPHTAKRTFIFSCISLGLSVFWIIGSILLIKGGWRQHHSNHTHWPWLAVTFLNSLLDMIAAVVFINDSFHTRTLNSVLTYINGIGSGFGNVDINTAWASWTMAFLYSRGGLFLLINLGLMVFAILDCTRFRSSVTSSEIERNYAASSEISNKSDEAEASDAAASSSPSVSVAKIPRPGLSQSFRSMKDLLFKQADSTNSSNGGRNRNRVNFQPEETTSDPIRYPRSFENLIAEQQRRLQGIAVDTSGRRSPAKASRSLPDLASEPSRGWRGTSGQLPSQMPWSYIAGAPANRMRDQLPPDEDLPPVPLPDYTAFQSHRKASVHRAASSLSSLKRAFLNSKSSHLFRAATPTNWKINIPETPGAYPTRSSISNV